MQLDVGFGDAVVPGPVATDYPTILDLPAPLLRAASAIHRFFHSQRPLWQYLRHIRRLINALGLPPHVLAGG